LAETLPPDAVPQRAIAALVRLIINYRLLTVLVSTVYFNAVGSRPVLAWVFVGVGVANLLPLLRWERVAAAVLRHPTVLAIDLVVTIGILLITGIDGPLLSYTFGTAFIAGILYSWTGAGVFTVLLVAAYWALLMGQSPLASLSSDFQAIVGTPSLYVLLAVGGAAVRDLLVRQARMEAALRAAREQAAHGEERARLARELHDTLGKTLHGISLLAGVLPMWIRRNPERAIREARALASAAGDAAAQARELQAGMRADRLDRPLEAVVRQTAEVWANEYDAAQVHLEIQPIPGLKPDQRIELLGILREALRNVQRHARARHVWVELLDGEETVKLRVRDDGCGLSGISDLDRMAAQGHFGLLGMRERVERVGGQLAITPSDPSGVVITAQVPRSLARGPAAALAPHVAGTSGAT
jgi:signal transduction histidine kinase